MGDRSGCQRAALLVVSVVVALSSSGCGGEGTAEPPSPEPEPPPPEPGCVAGELLEEDGTCREAGIAPEECGPGFEPDGARGCVAVLPAAPCEPGMMAIPGETACRPVAPCGEGTWGDIPVEASTVYVDASYAGADGIGTSDKPFTSLPAALASAPPGGMIALASGSYSVASNVSSPVRIWGRCPAMVELVAPATASAALVFTVGSDGSEVHDLAITGDGVAGLAVASAQNVALDRLWLHDLAGIALAVQGAGSATWRDGLVERATGIALNLNGATSTLERSVIRDTQLGDGRGWAVLATESASTASNMTMRSCVVSGSLDAGVLLTGTTALIEASSISDTASTGAAQSGWGIVAQDALTSAIRGELLVDQSVVQHSRGVGVFVGGTTATLRRSVVRNTRAADGDANAARAIGVENNPMSGNVAEVVLDRSVVEGGDGLGVFVSGAVARATSAIVRDIGVTPQLAAGVCLNARSYEDDGHAASVEMLGSVIRGCHLAGVAIEGSALFLDRSVVEDVVPRPTDQYFGRGIGLQSDAFDAPSSAVVIGSRIATVYEGGAVVIDSTMQLSDSLIEGIAKLPEHGVYGDGVVVYGFSSPAALDLDGTEIAHAERAALSNFGATVTVGDNALSCSPIFLAAEPTAVAMPTFDQVGETTCGCDGVEETCRVLTPGLSPPLALDP